MVVLADRAAAAIVGARVGMMEGSPSLQGLMRWDGGDEASNATKKFNHQVQELKQQVPSLWDHLLRF